MTWTMNSKDSITFKKLRDVRWRANQQCSSIKEYTKKKGLLSGPFHLI